MLYRIKQFLRSLFARLSPDDLIFIGRNLNPAEIGLFFRLSRPDQAHSACVARKISAWLLARGQQDDLLIKAALLHDLGKIDSGLNPFNRSIYVLADRFCRKLLKKFLCLKSVQAYYDHPALAMQYLADQDEDLKFLVRHHHQRPDQILHDQSGHGRLNLLQKMDEEC